MVKRRTFLRTALILSLGAAVPAALSGCGLKGPLYLPRKRGTDSTGSGNEAVPVQNTPLEEKASGMDGAIPSMQSGSADRGSEPRPDPSSGREP
ncbi:MAG: lipoprotein [Sutterellaceae bacterium]|nr:lipoprotein [Sutterellaceae bacterium]MDD7442402.1 lipoprotein [Sutterellaceae bacterium]MDY2867171.1 lipoprotein [Mesosutterella sp.]